MQVNELSSEGLKRAYKVTVSAQEIETKLSARLNEIGRTAKMPGFRPGKVPMTVLRQRYGASVMGDVLEQTVNESSQEALEQEKLRPALRPKIEITTFDEGKDLEYEMNVEVLPEAPAVDLDAIQLTKPVAPVDAARIEEVLQRVAEEHTHYHELTEPRPSQDGDQMTVDFVGKVDGEPFQGGTAADMDIVIGGNRLIPGFEEQLKDRQVGDKFDLTVTFPDDYGNGDLAGKAAVFETEVKAIKAPHALGVSDELAKHMGLESLEQLRENAEGRMREQHEQASRLHAKRRLLDHLAAHYSFEVPPGMVEMEFEGIWKQLQDEMTRTDTTFEQEGRTEDEAREEYRRIAERRVRLGLLLSDIGTRNEIKVEPQELQQAALAQAQRIPREQQGQFFDYLKNNPQAIEQLRAPIFEEKVVDFVLTKAKLEEQTVPVEELLRDPDDEPLSAEADAAAPDPSAAAAGSPTLGAEEAHEQTKAEGGPAAPADENIAPPNDPTAGEDKSA